MQQLQLPWQPSQHSAEGTWSGTDDSLECYSFWNEVHQITEKSAKGIEHGLRHHSKFCPGSTCMNGLVAYEEPRWG